MVYPHTKGDYEMVKRYATAQDEPGQVKFEKPSEKEHLFQVVDILEDKKNADIVLVKIEVVGTDEEGRTMLNRLSLDDKWKGFFATRLFLKAIGEEYKGDNFPIDTDNWIGRQFYATVIHNGDYTNIKEYNFDKQVEQPKDVITEDNKKEIAWDDEK